MKQNRPLGRRCAPQAPRRRHFANLLRPLTYGFEREFRPDQLVDKISRPSTITCLDGVLSEWLTKDYPEGKEAGAC